MRLLHKVTYLINVILFTCGSLMSPSSGPLNAGPWPQELRPTIGSCHYRGQAAWVHMEGVHLPALSRVGTCSHQVLGRTSETSNLPHSRAGAWVEGTEG